MKKSEVVACINGMSPELIARGKCMLEQGYGPRGIASNSPLTVKQAQALLAVTEELPDNTTLLRMVLDECDVLNPDGSAKPLSDHMVALMRVALA